jgi:hypothetical protein
LETGQIRSLVVNSFGGEELAAIRIGEEIVRRDITLVVDGACMSACADYLFLPARHRKVAPYSLVAFHHTSVSLLAMIPPDARANVAGYNKVAQLRAERFFADRKLPLSLLLEPQIAVRTRCYTLLKGKTPGQAEIAYQSEFVAWMPSRDYLKDSGIAFEGYWPETLDDFHTSWERLFPKGGKGRLAIGIHSHLLSESALRADLQKIPLCALPESTIRSLKERSDDIRRRDS